MLFTKAYEAQNPRNYLEVWKQLTVEHQMSWLCYMYKDVHMNKMWRNTDRQFN